MKKKNDTNTQKTVLTSCVIHPDWTKVYEEYIEPRTGEPLFIDNNEMTWDTVEIDDTIYAPIPSDDSAIKTYAVRLPTGILEYGTTKELFKEIQEHIHTYLEVSSQFEILASWYILLTWIYDRVDTLPYLRALGDTGTGKSRFLKVIGGLCYKPMFLSGAATPAPIFRMIERWGGTLVIDEADWYMSDEASEIIKILNCGFEKNLPVIRCSTDNPDHMHYFNTYCPKIIATRRTFKDKALESRCLTEVMKPLSRTDIPVLLPRVFHEREKELRDKLFNWRLKNWLNIDIEAAQGLQLDERLEPRLRQVMGYLPLLFDGDTNTLGFFERTLQEMNRDLIEERASSFDGMIVNSLLKIHDTNQEDIDPEPISAGDIADDMKRTYGLDKVTPQKVGIHLKSLGIKIARNSTKRGIDWDEEHMTKLRRRYQI